MSNKIKARKRRAMKTRYKIRSTGHPRLCIHRTPRHIYAQILSPAGDEVLVSTSTLDKSIKIDGSKGNIAAAEVVGKSIAEKAKAKGLELVAFDRSGFKYHGRVKALAEAARENGLQI